MAIPTRVPIRSSPSLDPLATVFPMSTKRETKSLTSSDEKDLKRLAEGSELFTKIRAAYEEWKCLTPRQYEIFVEARDKNAWRKEAKTINGSAVKNRFETNDGRPQCGDRSKPPCRAEATVIVGTWGFCPLHVDAAKQSLADWRKNLDEEEKKESAPVVSAASPSLEKESTPQPSQKERMTSRIASFLDDDGGEESDHLM